MYSIDFRLARLFGCLIITLFISFRPIDDEFIKRLLEQFRGYSRQQPIEKVYIHTDRDTYLTGETVWLKGYIFNGHTQEADTSSGVLYADLVDINTKRVRLRTQLRATAGYAPGQLALTDSLPSGSYQLRGYTNFMRNYPDAYYFSKTLTILSAEPNKTNAGVTQNATRPDVQFLPEGGQLVAGLTSRIAFKVLSASGAGMNTKGFVLDAKKDTVIGFATTHLGMGYFMLKPEATQTYTAYIYLANGALVAYPMPAVRQQGVVMQVENQTNKDNVLVYVMHNKAISDTSATLTLVAQAKGDIIQVAKIPFSRKLAVVRLPRDRFPEGIAQLTVFDETQKPVCERLVFIDKNEQMNVSVVADKPAYKNREQVTLTLTTTSSEGKPVPANLSLAAVDAQLAPEADSNGITIRSHLLLSSDLVGTVEQPDYYFNTDHKDRRLHLDILLMTQGWRRFAWADVLSGTDYL
jgi:hypothetical protein